MCLWQVKEQETQSSLEKWELDELGEHGVAVLFEPHAHCCGPYLGHIPNLQRPPETVFAPFLALPVTPGRSILAYLALGPPCLRVVIPVEQQEDDLGCTVRETTL